MGKFRWNTQRCRGQKFTAKVPKTAENFRQLCTGEFKLNKERSLILWWLGWKTCMHWCTTRKLKDKSQHKFVVTPTLQQIDVKNKIMFLNLHPRKLRYPMRINVRFYFHLKWFLFGGHVMSIFGGLHIYALVTSSFLEGSWKDSRILELIFSHIWRLLDPQQATHQPHQPHQPGRWNGGASCWFWISEFDICSKAWYPISSDHEPVAKI